MGSQGMACRQNPAPGAECRVGKCPSSAPLWRAPAYSEPPLPRYPPLLLLLLLWATLPPQLTSALPSIAPCFSSRQKQVQTQDFCVSFNGMHCTLQITRTCSAPTRTPPPPHPHSHSLRCSIHWDGATQLYGSCVL